MPAVLSWSSRQTTANSLIKIAVIWKHRGRLRPNIHTCTYQIRFLALSFIFHKTRHETNKDFTARKVRLHLSLRNHLWDSLLTLMQHTIHPLIRQICILMPKHKRARDRQINAPTAFNLLPTDYTIDAKKSPTCMMLVGDSSRLNMSAPEVHNRVAKI